MNPQRIEEFRQKLRRGDAVRVVQGQVQLDSGPQAAGAPPQAGPAQGAQAQAAPLAVPSPQGVQVKAHEWGAS